MNLPTRFPEDPFVLPWLGLGGMGPDWSVAGMTAGITGGTRWCTASIRVAAS